MNKTLAISTIALVAVVMVMGSIAPALANDVSGHKGVLVNAPGQCGVLQHGQTCVAVDRDADGICDSPAFIIPTKVADRLGIQAYQNCGETGTL